MSELSRAALGTWLMILALIVVGMSEVSFPWEALATFVAGTAAVIGAVSVGKRQAGIAERQVSILEKQVELEKATVRGNLFDRRFAVFTTTEDWIHYVLDNKGASDDTKIKDFKMAIDQARFLFGKEPNERITELSVRSIQYHSIMMTIASHDASDSDYMKANKAEIDALEKWLKERVYQLSDVFGPELSVFESEFVARRDTDINKYWVKLTGDDNDAMANWADAMSRTQEIIKRDDD